MPRRAARHIDANASPQPTQPSIILLGLASSWLIAFFIYFQTFILPNNSQFSRLDIWRELPVLLLDLMIPVPDENSPPSGWQYLPQRYDLILIASFIQVSAWAWGQLCWRLIKPQGQLNSLERFVFGQGLGLGVVALLTLGFGLLGWLNWSLFVILQLFVVIFTIVVTWHDRLPDKESQKPKQPGRFEIELLPFSCVLAMLPFVCLMLLGALLPSTDFDVREYHLQGPKEFYQNGRITMLPHNVYTSFPFLTEMLSLQAMVLRGDWLRGALAGKGVLMGFAPLTALALFAAGNRWFGRTAGLLAALIFISTPWTYRISIIAYAEGGLTCYLFLTTFAALICCERSAEAQTVPLRTVLLTGLLAGCAMSCKYPAALMVIIPVGVLLLAMPWLQRYGSDETGNDDGPVVSQTPGVFQSVLKMAAVYALGCMITVGPWLLKNAVETGNPIYPLLYSVLGGADWDAEMNAKWQRAHSPGDHHVTDLGIKLIDVMAKSDWQSVLIYGFAPLGFLAGYRGRKQMVVVLLWCYTIYLFLAWWGFTHRIDRFWVPMLPVTALLAGIGVTWTAHRLWRYVGSAVLVAALLFQLGYISTALCGPNWYLMDLAAAQLQAGKITNPNLIELNAMLPDEARVLSVGEAAVFNAEFEVVYNTVFDESIFEQWCAAPEPAMPRNQWKLKPSEVIRQKFQEAGITHVMVNWQEILRYRLTYGYTNFVFPERFAKLVRDGVLRPAPFGQGFRPVESLSGQEHAEILQWGPMLISTFQDGKTYMKTFEVFTVAPVSRDTHSQGK